MGLPLCLECQDNDVSKRSECCEQIEGLVQERLIMQVCIMPHSVRVRRSRPEDIGPFGSIRSNFTKRMSFPSIYLASKGPN